MQCRLTPSNRGQICSRLMSNEELAREKNKYLKLLQPGSDKRFRKISEMHSNAAAALKWMDDAGINWLNAPEKEKRKLITPEVKLVLIAEEYRKVIDYIIEKSKMLKECRVLNRYIAIVLVGQLLWGKQSIPLGTRGTSQLLYCEADLKEGFLEASTILQSSYQTELPIYVRINTLSISLEQCISAFCKEGWNLLVCPKTYDEFLEVVSRLKEAEFIRDFHISELLVFPPKTSFYIHPGYIRGKFVLQDKASCLASFLLNPKPGSRVYDMCAAPGKTTNHLANIVNNEGNVYATDIHPHRFNRMQSFLQLTNSTCVETMLADAKNIDIDNVNYVLLDVPTSYTGVFYRRSKNGLVKRLKQNFQVSFKLLMYALQHFTTAKRVVYAACTRYPEEAQKVVECAVNMVKGSYKLLDVKELLWNQWSSVGCTRDCYPSADKCLQTIPDYDLCHGYFIAVFERNFEVSAPPRARQLAYKNGGLTFRETSKDKPGDESLHDNSNKRKLTLEGAESEDFDSKNDGTRKKSCYAAPTDLRAQLPSSASQTTQGSTMSTVAK